MSLIDDIGKELGKKKLPTVHVGDTVEVHYLIKEGDKERVQVFKGTILAVTGRGVARSITVRRIVQGEGVERAFPLHSPRIAKIEVVRRGDARRAKLYYLRDRVGKSRRLRDQRRGLDALAGREAAAAESKKQAEAAAPAEAE